MKRVLASVATVLLMLGLLISLAGRSRYHIALLPPHEWGFSELDLDGTHDVEIRHYFGVISVSETHSR